MTNKVRVKFVSSVEIHCWKISVNNLMAQKSYSNEKLFNCSRTICMWKYGERVEGVQRLNSRGQLLETSCHKTFHAMNTKNALWNSSSLFGSQMDRKKNIPRTREIITAGDNKISFNSLCNCRWSFLCVPFRQCLVKFFPTYQIRLQAF